MIRRAILYTVFNLFMIAGILSQESISIFRDTTDGAFDISKWLLELHGFVPLASIITEPALGYGGVLAGAYFIPKNDTTPGFKMPDIVGAGGGYTQNGTWFAGGGYAGFWKDDRIRYRGILGYGDIHLTYYRYSEILGKELSASYNMRSLFFLQQLMFRMGDTPIMLGGKYYLAKTKILRFDEKSQFDIDPRDFNMVSSGLGLIAEYETFNNVLSPSEGIRIHLEYAQSLELLGSDKNFNKTSFFTMVYFPVTTKWVSGIRLESNMASNNTPFYSMPFINLRGVPLMRYQGEFTILTETEQIVKFQNRWSLVGFAGIGSIIPSLDNMEFGDLAWNMGTGFRYKIARLLGLQMGMDIARGPEDWAFYIVFGNAWLR